MFYQVGDNQGGLIRLYTPQQAYLGIKDTIFQNIILEDYIQLKQIQYTPSTISYDSLGTILFARALTSMITMETITVKVSYCKMGCANFNIKSKILTFEKNTILEGLKLSQKDQLFYSNIGFIQFQGNIFSMIDSKISNHYSKTAAVQIQTVSNEGESYIYIGDSEFINIDSEDNGGVFNINPFARSILTTIKQCVFKNVTTKNYGASVFISKETQINNDLYAQTSNEIQILNCKFQMVNAFQGGGVLYSEREHLNIQFFNSHIKDSFQIYEDGEMDFQDITINKQDQKPERNSFYPQNLPQDIRNLYDNNMKQIKQYHDIEYQLISIGTLILVQNAKSFTIIAGGAYFIKFDNQYEFNITNCKFQNNTSIVGGAMVQNYEQLPEINLENNEIVNNKVFYIGGGIYYENYFNSSNYKRNIERNIIKNNYLIQKTVQLLQQEQNQHDSYDEIEQNISSSIQNIQLVDEKQIFQNQIEQNTQKLIFELYNLKPGQKLPLIKLKLVDGLDQKYRLHDQLQNQFKINWGLQNNNNKEQLKEKVEIKGHLTPDIIEDYIIFDQLYIYGTNSTKSYLEIIYQPDLSSQINDFIYMDSNKHLTLKIYLQTRNCMAGEVLILEQNLLSQCRLCNNEEFSLVDPHVNDLKICLPCPQHAQCPGGNQLVVDEFHFRESKNSDIILACKQSPRNCRGGNFVGDESCSDNFIGVLCEECNYHQSFIKVAKDNCFDCKEQSTVITILSVFFFIGLIYIIISIDATIKRIKVKQKYGELKNSPAVQRSRFYAAMVMKQLVHYSHILSIINQYDLKMFNSVSTGLISSIDPIVSYKKFLECYSMDISKSTNVDFIYISFFLDFLIPLVFISLFSIYNYLIKNKNNRYRQQQYQTTMLVCIFLFFQPQLFKNGIKLLTCRKIGENSYISSNILFQCDTQQYYILSFGIILPLILIFTLIIPFILGIKIYKRMKNEKSIAKYQFLVGDYVDDNYYWEMIKFLEKFLIMIIATLFITDDKASALLINLVIIGYASCSFFLKPYKTKLLNKLDLLTNIVCFINFYFIIMAFDQEIKGTLWWIAIVMILGSNICMVCYFMYIIYQAYKPLIKVKYFKFKVTVVKYRFIRNNLFSKKSKVKFMWYRALLQVQKKILNQQKSRVFNEDRYSFITEKLVHTEKNEEKFKNVFSEDKQRESKLFKDRYSSIRNSYYPDVKINRVSDSSNSLNSSLNTTINNSKIKNILNRDSNYSQIISEDNQEYYNDSDDETITPLRKNKINQKKKYENQNQLSVDTINISNILFKNSISSDSNLRSSSINLFNKEGGSIDNNIDYKQLIDDIRIQEQNNNKQASSINKNNNDIDQQNNLSQINQSDNLLQVENQNNSCCISDNDSIIIDADKLQENKSNSKSKQDQNQKNTLLSPLLNKQNSDQK